MLAWLFREASAPGPKEILDGARFVVASDLTLLECERALIKAEAAGQLSQLEAGQRRALLDATSSRWTLLKLGGEILDRARETRCGDDVVDLEDELGGALRLSGMHAERLAGALDALDRRIEHDDAAREDMVLIGLHIPRADSDERARVDR